MKILMVSSAAFPYSQGGVAEVVHHLAKEMINLGHQVYIFTLNVDPLQKQYSLQENLHEGYRVKAITLKGSIDDYFNAFKEEGYKNAFVEKALENDIQKIRPDVVHFHAVQGIGANSIVKAKELGCKTVLTMHDWWWLCPHFFMADCYYNPCNQININRDKCVKCLEKVKTLPDAPKEILQPDTMSFLKQRQSYLMEVLEDKVDHIVVVSEYLKNYLQANHINFSPISVNLNGVEKAGIKKENPTQQPSKLVFGFLGGAHELKGAKILKEAFKDLEPDHWELHIYGLPCANKGAIKKTMTYLKNTGIKGLIRKLRSIKNSKNIKDPVHIKQYSCFLTQDKDKVYDKIDVLLVLSVVKESSSLVVREALARGIPVITTPSGGPLEVIEQGKNGIILENCSSQELRKNVIKLLTTNMFLEMTNWIAKHPYSYTYAEQAQQLEEIYEKGKVQNNGDFKK